MLQISSLYVDPFDFCGYSKSALLLLPLPLHGSPIFKVSSVQLRFDSPLSERKKLVGLYVSNGLVYWQIFDLLSIISGNKCIIELELLMLSPHEINNYLHKTGKSNTDIN